MAKPKGKTPSLLSMSTGTPSSHVCGKTTPCGRCNKDISTGKECFKIPKQKSGFTSNPLFCVDCTRLIIEKTKSDITAIESTMTGEIL
ncbi:hypothetical protein [Thalassospira alkalitolerans]|uniref:hypothetical protein n=1 Tax=Thalassospira alkalitolerans TaxID=1293890 RepID=UPI003AA949B6